MRHAYIILCCLLSILVLTAEAQQASLGDRQVVSRLAPELALQLQSPDFLERQKAVETIRQVGQASSRALSDNLSGWIDPLLENQCYDDVLNLSAIAINDRGFDITITEKLQEGRVQALIGQGKFDQALVEAKGYYNVCLLKNTQKAVDTICTILEQQGKSPVASRLRFEQAHAPATQPADQSMEVVDGGLLLNATVLNSIRIDASPWQESLDILARGHTFNDLMKEGNFALLLDKPKQARKCFEAACNAADSSRSKDIREAVEGIARSIRDMPDGSLEKANTFITDLRAHPEVAGAGLTEAVSFDKLRTAAQQTALPATYVQPPPPLENARVQQSGTITRSAIKVLTDFECATPVSINEVSATQFEIDVPGISDQTGWFMFRVEGVKDQTVRFDIKMANPIKWWSLNPVFTYCERLDAPDTFRASSADAQSQSSTAWNGPLIPNHLAEQWSYIPNVWKSSPRMFSFVQHFERDSSYICMRIPYTPAYNTAYMRGIDSKSAQLVEIGRSVGGRPLLMVKIGGADQARAKQNPCVLVYAGEHPDEHDSYWAVQGMIEFLLSDSPEASRLRDHITFLIIPMLDPDGNALSRHADSIISSFSLGSATPETIAYANWFKSWVDQGNRLDLILDLHSQQSAEGRHLMGICVETDAARRSSEDSVNSIVLEKVKTAGFSTVPQFQASILPNRLAGWLRAYYGAVAILYEVDAQEPTRHLDLSQVHLLGSLMGEAAGAFLESSAAQNLFKIVDARRAQRQQAWKDFRDFGGLRDENAFDAETKRFIPR